MRMFFFIASFLFACTAPSSPELHQQAAVVPDPIVSTVHHEYLWLDTYDGKNCLINRISLPPNYVRIQNDSSSFASWLRHIPLKAGKPPVHLYNGQLKENQAVHQAVVDIGVGTKDLQQCADAVMRLRAEYLFANDQKGDIAFKFTSGHNCTYQAWAEGFRPIINGNNVDFLQNKPPDYSYNNFKDYMQTIFNYCGTYSLDKELKSKSALHQIAIGDVFIHGGFPGHAVIVMDVAINPETTERIFLLAQSYMPAQEIHILKNLSNDALSPWFSANFMTNLNTPEWIFKKSELKQF